MIARMRHRRRLRLALDRQNARCQLVGDHALALLVVQPPCSEGSLTLLRTLTQKLDREMRTYRLLRARLERVSR